MKGSNFGQCNFIFSIHSQVVVHSNNTRDQIHFHADEQVTSVVAHTQHFEQMLL